MRPQSSPNATPKPPQSHLDATFKPKECEKKDDLWVSSPMIGAFRPETRGYLRGLINRSTSRAVTASWNTIGAGLGTLASAVLAGVSSRGVEMLARIPLTSAYCKA
jgi:hypothetical protein